ncbi:putative ribonuclease H-like domain-containing protein [Tanacetum coccineum]
MRPFGCPVTILNTIDHLGKFNGKANEGFFVGYFTNSKAFRVFNSRTRIVEENLHVQFSENTPNIAGSGPNWLFDIDALTKSMNYKPVVAGNQTNGNAGTKACNNAGEEEKKDVEEPRNEDSEVPSTKEPREDQRVNQEIDASVNNTNTINTVSPTVNAAGIEDNDVDENTVYGYADDPNMPELEDIVYSYDDEDVGAEVDMNNLDAFMPVSPIPTIRIHKDHPVEQIIRDLNLAPQTRRMTTNLKEHGLFSSVQQRTNHKDFQNCLFACFLSQEEPKKVWTLVELPNGKRAIGTKWIFRNKKDERAIRLFLAYASYKDFVVYQMDVKSAFLYGKIEEEVYVCQPPGFEDPDFPDRVYKVEKALYGLHQAPRAWYETLSTYLLDNGFQRRKIDKTLFIKRGKDDILLVQVYVDDIIFGSTKKSLCTEFEKMMHKKFQMSSIGKLTFFLGLQVKQKKDVIFISQYKYVTEIFKKFGFTDVKTTSTPIETQKPLLDEDGKEVDVHLYRSMIGSLMYLTSSRPNIMFAVCAYARYQVNPKVSHLHAVKRIFTYLKGQPKLGLWYLKDSPFDLVAYTDSDYAEASLDRKSTTGGCQFLGCRLISWQCKKQTVVANSTLEAEYVAASSYCSQVLWIQNKLLDYGHHFIKDSNEKKLIQMIKIHTDKNVADLLTKAFDNGIGVNPGDSKLMLLGINLLLLRKVNAAMHKLTATREKGIETQNRTYIAPSYTKKIFANMRRQGKYFSGRVTPLFPTMVVQAQEEMGEGSVMPTDPHHTPIITQTSLSQPQRKQKSRRPKRKDTKIPQSSGPIDNVADEAVNEEMYDNLERAATTATSLDAEHDRVNISKTQSKATPNEPSSLGTSSGGGPRREETIGDTIAQTRPENVSKRSNDLLLAGVNTPRSDEDRLKLNELRNFVPNFNKECLTWRTQRLLKIRRLQEDASKQGRKIDDIDKDAEITLVDETQGRYGDEDMFGVHDLDGDEVVVESEVVAKKKDDEVNVVKEVVSAAEEIVNVATITEDEITLAQALAELKSVKPKDKGKGIMVEEPLKMKKKDQISFDEQEAIRLQTEFDEEVRLAREKDEASVTLIEEWND